MSDPYFELLEADAVRDDRLERAEHAQARRDRLQDFAPLVSDARAAGTAGRRDPERKDRS